MPISLQSRYLGSLLGLAAGDAVGTAVEFSPRGTFPPVLDMVGGGPFGLKPGQWTDDTSMALCLAESLVSRQGFDALNQMARYLNWWKWGYLSSTGECFDIGMTVAGALEKFSETGNPFAGSTDPAKAGNGSLMRLAPVVLYYYPDRELVIRFAGESSRTTHGAAEAIECCRLFAVLLMEALSGTNKDAMFSSSLLVTGEKKIQAIASGALMAKSENEIFGTGYCVDSLEAALWCFMQTSDFESAVLRAANLGDDADTTAAIVGQLAGAYYGRDGIPQRWLDQISLREHIETLAIAIHAQSTSNSAQI